MTDRPTSYLWDDNNDREILVGPVSDPRRVRVGDHALVAYQAIEAIAQAAGLGNVGPWLTMHDIADQLGLTYKTVRTYRTKGKLPDPDRWFGKTPVWRPSSITRLGTRP